MGGLVYDDGAGTDTNRNRWRVLAAAGVVGRGLEGTMPTTRLSRSFAELWMAHSRPRFALIGSGDDAASALFGALVLKEAAKVLAEGYVGGEFRHGPFELAGPGMTALLFGSGDPADLTLPRLAHDIAVTGAFVATVGPNPYEGTELIPTPPSDDLGRLIHAAVAVQQLSVALARVNGFVPGEFLYGEKVTSAL